MTHVHASWSRFKTDGRACSNFYIPEHFLGYLRLLKVYLFQTPGYIARSSRANLSPSVYSIGDANDVLDPSVQ